ncbi:hypothetical protein L218DRAFT_953738 [Marasmius fiardii PR-910]|nr:hypothetical protein L218DRAFT_953738 [Marasmius fiardii PR-910]
MAPESGRVYIIVNAKSGTALDASDSGAIHGYQRHGGPNQRWTVTNNGSHWTFRNDNGQYLGYDQSQVADGLALYAVNQAVEWDIWPDRNDNSLLRIYVPGWQTAMNIDLSDNGNANNGTPVTLWGEWEGIHQAWRFEEA